MKFLALGLLATGLVFAGSNDLTHRPRSFNAHSGKAVFTDFTEAFYKITYDVPNQKAWVVAKIKFDMPEEGFPIFDSVVDPTYVRLDGKTVTAIETETPNEETFLRVVNTLTSRGQHEMEIQVPITEGVAFKEGEVRSAFWTTDLEDRSFLESYIPANFEYDQVKMIFDVTFIGVKEAQIIYTNGVSQRKTNSSYRITYPDYFTSSSLYFHTLPKSGAVDIRFSLKSIDGRDIPAVAYITKPQWSDSDASLLKLKRMITEVFQELEGDFGPFPHPSITVYNAGSGGMEYCGATMTSQSALGHEFFHSYFARGVMPANGNSGWLDEALASWRDEGYLSLARMTGSSQMSSHEHYTRSTDRMAYKFGERFMRHMDYKVRSKGGLKPFLRHMVEFKKFSPLFVEEFIQEMDKFFGMSFESDFKKYTYGQKNFVETDIKSAPHKHHQKMSIAELKNFL